MTPQPNPQPNPRPPLLPPAAPGPVLVGFSGGLDSTVLLHLLAADPDQRSRGLGAIHVHHGLQADADAWAQHCRQVCARLEVPLTVARVTVERDSGQGLEAAARQARYQAFEDAMDPGTILALAHHQDDQAETFLLRALRASGVDGLQAMPAWRRLEPGWLWRPLLQQPRQALVDFARAHKLDWVEDPSNAGADHDRNHLRQRVLPLLLERWPHAGQALARSAGLTGEAARLLAADDPPALANVATADRRVVNAQRLLEYPRERRARILRLWLAGLGLPPLPAEGVARIESDLLGGRADAVPGFAWSGALVRRWRDLLHAGREQAPLAADFQTRWDGRTPLKLPTGDTLALEAEPADASPSALPEPLLVHARRGGERIVLPGRDHSHALKQVLQDRAVAPWVRERLPLLSAADGSLLAAGDLVLSAAFDRQLRTCGLRLSWRDTGGPA